MASTSKIEWTDATWQVTAGCTRVSEGCRNCYAERMVGRKAAMALADKAEGKNPGRKAVALQVVNQRPGTGRDGYGPNSGWNREIVLLEDRLADPLKWRKPRKIFVNSESDLFHEKVPFEYVDKVFAVMALTPHHTYQILTKRPERMAEYFDEGGPLWDREGHWPECADDVGGNVECVQDISGEYRTQPTQWPLPNVWLGTSVENQEAADKRIPHLLECPAAVRFLSCEPLIGPVDLNKAWCSKGDTGYVLMQAFGDPQSLWACHQCGGTGYAQTEPYIMACSACSVPMAMKGNGIGIHWVIVGGESGSKARPVHPDWARSIRDQCQAAGVPFLFKQWGEWGSESVDMVTGESVFRQFDTKQKWVNKAHTWVNGGTCVDMAGRVLERGRDFDEAKYPVAIVHKLGKKAAGRMLDGRIWDEFPQSAVILTS